MSKANRTCYCCGRKYYYCPSCNDDRRDPKIYTMWDSEVCKEIFSALTNESFKKITTLECKKRLVELGVDENTVLKDAIRNNVNRIMSCEEEVIEENKNDTIEESSMVLEEIVKSEEKSEDVIAEVSETEDFKVTTDEVKQNIENIKKNKRTKKSSVKNKENSEVDLKNE